MVLKTVLSAASPTSFVLDRVEDLSEAQFAYLMLVPLFVLLGAMAFWPLVRTFELSLHADAAFATGSTLVGEFVGIENYVAILSGERSAFLASPIMDFSRPFQSALIVTLIFTAGAVTIETIVGFGQALVLNESFRGRRLVRVALIIPWAVPIVIQGMIFYLLFQPGIGFLVSEANPTILQQLGIFGNTPLSTASESVLILVVADVWKTSAFMALIILAGLQSVDRSLYNVGKVAGASKFQQFKMITLPLVLPSVLVAMLFRTIGAMRVYGLIETVVGCNTVPSLSCLVVTTFQGSRMYGTSAAVAFITAALIGVVVTIYIVQYADTEGGV